MAHTETQSPWDKIPKPNLSLRKWIFIALGVGVMLLGSYLLRNYLHDNPRTPSSRSQSKVDYTEREEIAFPLDPTQPSGRSLTFSLVHRTFAHGPAKVKNGLYYLFRDQQSGEILSQNPLEELWQIEQLDFRRFSNGLYYLVLNQKMLFEIDPQKMTLREITSELLVPQGTIRTLELPPVITEGVAPEHFNVMTTRGESLECELKSCNP